MNENLKNWLMCLWVVCFMAAMCAIAVRVISAQEQPAAGERRGNRCYDGKMWKDCGMAEKPEPPPHPQRQWTITELPGDMWVSSARIDVVDTAGVCLYVIRSGSHQPSIMAVPKSQLPKGAGCQ